MTTKKRNRSNKKSSSSSSSSSSRKRRRTIVRVANAIASRTRANAMKVAIAAYATPELFEILRKRQREAVVRRDHKLDNEQHFRDWKIPLDDFLAKPEKYGLKDLEELARLGKNTRRSKRVDNRVFRCVTCGHDDYEDGAIVYAIVIQEHVAGSSRSNPMYVDRIMWVCDYGMRILREYDCRINAEKKPKDKTAYAVVRIPKKGGKTQKVLVHALLFNEKYGRGPFHETDHIENSDAATNGLNNLFANVRDGAPDGTRRLNLIHRSTQKNNTSGHKGVCDYKGRNEGGHEESKFGYWQVTFEVFDKITKKTTVITESFGRDNGDEDHKQKKFEEACEFQEKKQKEYVKALEEDVEPIRVRQSHWFARRELKEVFEEASELE